MKSAAAILTPGLLLLMLTAAAVQAASADSDTTASRSLADIAALAASAEGDTTSADSDTTATSASTAEEDPLKQQRMEEIRADILEKTPNISEDNLQKAAESIWQREQQTGWFVGWETKPSANLIAKAAKISWGADLVGTLKLKGDGSMALTNSINWEDYRKQDRQVERRSSLLSFASGKSLPVTLTSTMNWNWSDDQTINSADFLNQNRTELRTIMARAARDDIHTGLVRHSMVVDGNYDQRMGLVQSRRMDSNDGRLGGSVRSAVDAVEGVTVTSTLHLSKSLGDKTLGDISGDASALQDTLGCGVFYDRAGWKGSFELRRANATKRYLDYHRNPSGIVDTTSVAEADKVVNEHEKIDAISMDWDVAKSFGRVSLTSSASRSLDEQSFFESGVGIKEKLQDDFRSKVSYRYATDDSVSFEYRYLWKWDNQTYQSATEARGRQINKRREFNVQIDQMLVGTTKLTLRSSTALKQDFAENEFNDNDRDRYDSSGYIKLDSDLGLAKPYARISFQHSEDLSIRAIRSSNNNAKDIYEITAGYNWPMTPRVTVAQDYRLSIQYTDYLFSYLEQVRREDDYNKRGMIITKVNLKPSERLRVALSYDWNTKFNANRTGTTASGIDQYHRDQEQRIGKIDVEISYDINETCKIEGATYRTRDTRDNLDGTDPTIRVSGQLWVGMDVVKKWGGSSSGKGLNASVRRYFAYGSTVQSYNKEYWDADISFVWMF